MSPTPPADINPYASPSAASATAPFDPERPRFRIVAVVVGCLVDIVSSTVAGVAFGIVVSILLVVRDASLERLPQVLADSIPVALGELLLGLCCSILGGYVAAWMARQRELQHALATGIASLAIGIALLSLQFLLPLPLAPPSWSTIVALLLTVPAALLGGFLRRAVVGRNRR